MNQSIVSWIRVAVCLALIGTATVSIPRFGCYCPAQEAGMIQNSVASFETLSSVQHAPLPKVVVLDNPNNPALLLRKIATSQHYTTHSEPNRHHQTEQQGQALFPLRPWYDPIGMFEFGPPASVPYSYPSVGPPFASALPNRQQSTTIVPPRTALTASPLVRQVSYVAENGTGTPGHSSTSISVPVNRAVASSTKQLPGTPSSELHKPWNLDQFVNKRDVRTETYRLVADTQPQPQTQTQQRMPPPAANFARPVSAPSVQSSQTISRTTKSGNLGDTVPVLGIGRNLANEFRPSNDRTWSRNHAVLQTAEFNGNTVLIRNVRYTKYQSEDVYTTRYYDSVFNLDEIRTFDLIIVPFHAMPSVAHVEASFGFADGRHVGLSIEARYEEGEKYDPVAASMRQFELIYVFADERDLIRIGTDVNKNNVHLYRLKLEPHEVRAIFVDALQRANSVAKKPEFYHPLSNSCVTNLITHINKGRPKAIPREYRTLLPGLMDSYVYDLKLVDTSAKTFKEAKEIAKINWLVEIYGDLEYFSAGIRQNRVAEKGATLR